MMLMIGLRGQDAPRRSKDKTRRMPMESVYETFGIKGAGSPAATSGA
ncbi:MAG: hypothetical protein J6D54_05990 [Olsenella sp.]|nr:hypothetical protein [Olsenella sp.]